MLEIKLLSNEKLTEEDLDYLGMDGWDSEDYSTYLRITHNDKIISLHCDGGEPEDNSFGRDWSWVSGAIKKAYELGVEDGYKK